MFKTSKTGMLLQSLSQTRLTFPRKGGVPMTPLGWALVGALAASTLWPGLGNVETASADTSGATIENSASRLFAGISSRGFVDLEADNAQSSQEFDIIEMNNGTESFRIKSELTGKCLGVSGWTNGTGVTQLPCDGAVSNFVPASGRALKSLRPDPALLWHAAQVLYKAEQRDCSIDSFGCHSMWRKIIKNQATGKCLDAANRSLPSLPRSGARLQQWDCVTSGNARRIVNQWWDMGAPTFR